LRTANSPHECGGVDKHGASSETAAGITTLLELADELVDELELQRKQLHRIRTLPPENYPHLAAHILQIRGHYIPEAKVVKGSVKKFCVNFSGRMARKALFLYKRIAQ
jgi:hypothetical protein